MQSIANLIRFFSYARQAPVMMETTRNNRFLFHVSKHSKDMLRQDVRILRADLASTAFGKIIIAVYGQIIKKGALSVNPDEIWTELVEQHCI